MLTVQYFVYGSEFGKGTAGMVGSLEGDSVIFENKPIILKDRYQVTGSDMAQIGWIEVSTENGATGYLWYMKSEHETRLRFDDYLETAMIEAVPAGAGSEQPHKVYLVLRVSLMPYKTEVTYGQVVYLTLRRF